MKPSPMYMRIRSFFAVRARRFELAFFSATNRGRSHRAPELRLDHSGIRRTRQERRNMGRSNLVCTQEGYERNPLLALNGALHERHAPKLPDPA